MYKQQTGTALPDSVPPGPSAMKWDLQSRRVYIFLALFPLNQLHKRCLHAQTENLDMIYLSYMIIKDVSVTYLTGDVVLYEHDWKPGIALILKWFIKESCFLIFNVNKLIVGCIRVDLKRFRFKRCFDIYSRNPDTPDFIYIPHFCPFYPNSRQ